ncbi:hypothetical protein C0J52_05590, partial [Blattella germanica]
LYTFPSLLVEYVLRYSVLNIFILRKIPIFPIFIAILQEKRYNLGKSTGLVLGVYASDDKVESVKLTNAAQKFNESVGGALLEHIKL